MCCFCDDMLYSWYIQVLADTIDLPCRIAKGCKYCSRDDASSCLVRFGLDRYLFCCLAHLLFCLQVGLQFKELFSHGLWTVTMKWWSVKLWMCCSLAVDILWIDICLKPYNYREYNTQDMLGGRCSRKKLIYYRPLSFKVKKAYESANILH